MSTQALQTTFAGQFGLGCVASTALTLPVADTNGMPGSPTKAMIRCEGQPVRWRDDNTAPTAAVGQLLNVGDVLKCDASNISKIRFIQTAATATLNVNYYA